MEAEFLDGEQDLTHEEGITFDDPAAPVKMRVGEQMVRRLVKVAFLKMAQVRKKEYWEMTEEELDEFAPGLTAYINQTDWMAELVEKVDAGAGPGLFLYAFLYRAAKDFREEQKKHPKVPKKMVQMNQTATADPLLTVGAFDPKKEVSNGI